MTWDHPVVLVLLAAPLAGEVIWGRQVRKRLWPGLARVAVSGGRVEASSRENSVRPWRLWATLALAIVALAGPRWGGTDETTEEPAREVLIALDLSRSMLVADVKPSRIDRAHAVMRSLLDALGGERTGVVVFSGGAYVQVPLSSDYQIMREFLPVLRPGYMPRGGSDYGAMLRAAAEGFSADKDMDRYLIVLGDGESTTEGWQAELPGLRQKGVRILALGVGTEAGGAVPARHSSEPSPFHSRLTVNTLQQLATATDGIYVDASTSLNVPSLLAQSVELGKRKHRAEREAEHAAARYQWALAVAVALGALGLWSEIAIRPRTRQVQSAGRRLTPRVAAAASALVLVAALTGPGRMHAHDIGDEADVPITALGKLRKLVAHVAGHPVIEVPDLLRIAELTVNYGLESFAKGENVSEGAIADGLEAVRHGEALAPMLPEWAHLRQDLERLRIHQGGGDPARRPPEQKKEAYDEEDRPTQTNGQGSQQTTSESTGQGGVALSDVTLGELSKEPPRAHGATPAPKRVRPSTDPNAGPTAGTAAASPLHNLLLKHFHEVTKEDQPGILFQTLSGGVQTDAAGGKDW